MKNNISFQSFFSPFYWPPYIIRFYKEKWEKEAREHKEKKQLAQLTGMSVSELEKYAWYFRISLNEMHTYYMYFGRLPEPDYITVIKHIGVANLIAAVSTGQIQEKLNNHE